MSTATRRLHSSAPGRRIPILLIAVSSIVLIAATGFPQAASAQGGTAPTPPTTAPTTAPTTSTTPPTTPPTSAAPTAPAGDDAPKRRVIVKLKVSATPEDVLSASQVGEQRARIAAAQTSVSAETSAKGSQELRRYVTVPALALDATDAEVDRITANPLVESVKPDGVQYASLADSVPLIGATQAHALGYTGAGWTVAILDTGVDSSHPFFGGRVVDEACFASRCPNGSSSQVGSGAATPCTALGCDHGTHVAGIAAGSVSGHEIVLVGGHVAAR